jgi:hypothetical protein
LNFKAEIKRRIYTTKNIRRLAGISYSLYQIRSAIGLKTRGSSGFHFLALNKILKETIPAILTIGIVRGDDFSETELIKLHKWSVKQPENHILIFIHPYQRACKIIVGEKYAGKMDNKEIDCQLEKVNALFQDGQFIRGVDEMASYIERKLSD